MAQNIKVEYVVVFLLFVVVLWCLMKRNQCGCNKRDEFTSGFGVTSGLAMNNRTAYCMPPNASGSFSGGCFLPSRVIV